MAAPVPSRGTVFLVGAGPGDPELLTLKGRRLLECADAVFYDELLHARLLDFAGPEAERIYVGKRAHEHALPQVEIVRLMIERAAQGWCVVRLKGGDPFLFGRGGEEAQLLSAAGIAWEAIPGVSAGIAVPEAAGIPVTHRGTAASVRFVTGHPAVTAELVPELRCVPGETLVIFMGLATLADTIGRLLAGGAARHLPVAVIERGTTPEQRITTGTLSDIVSRTAESGIQSPALVVIGDVVRLREQWLHAGHPTANPTPADLPGVVFLAHGSSQRAWHASVERFAEEYGVGGRFVRAAYLEPATPRFDDVVAEAVAVGVTRLIVVPYFLAAGLHVNRDIPALVAAAQQRYPDLLVHLADCLEGHPALRTALWARTAEATAALQAEPERAPTPVGGGAR